MPIDTYFGSLWQIFKWDGPSAFLAAFASSFLVRMLPLHRRLRMFDEDTLCRESAVCWIAGDTSELIPVLNSLIVSGVIILGRRRGVVRAQEDFISIVRKAAYRRSLDGGDPTELHLILDDLKHHRNNQSG